MIRRCPVRILLALVCVALLTPVVRAQEEAEVADVPKIVELKAGFDGRFKVGCWAPFEITLEGGHTPATDDVELIVVDGDGVPSRVQTPPKEPVSVGAHEKVVVKFFAKVGQLTSGATVNFRRESANTIPQPPITRRFESFPGILPNSSRLILTLGGPFSSFEATHFENRDVAVVNLPNASALPSEWFGLEGVDAVVIATGGDEIDPLLLTASPQLDALEQWVRMGGTLVLSVGRHGERLLGGDSPLARFAPGKFESIVARVPSASLETFANSSDPIEGAEGRFLIDVTRLADASGKVVAYAGAGPRNLPLVVRSPRGFGQIVFVACDLDRAPLVTWPGRMSLADQLLSRSAFGTERTEEAAGGEVTTLGFVDLSGQLRGALDQFAGVRVVPFWLVALLAVAYIACIGPLDYYVVRRFFGRMEATWITFAVTVIAFSAGTYLLAYGLKGSTLRVNRVELVDVDVESRGVRGTSFSNLFSPASAAYDLSLDPAGAVSGMNTPRTLFSWLGLPGDGFGGMNPASASMPMFTVPYDFAPKLDALAGVPIAVWSTKPFVGRWWAEADSPIKADLSDDGRLVGTLECRFEAPLENAVLIYDTWAYPLGKLEPGRVIDIGKDLDPQTVETYLRQVTVRGDREFAPPFEQTSFDVPRIVEIMSCHELAGGRGYTGLDGTYQEFVDLSKLVRDGRAILIGHRPKAATRLVCDGQPLDDPAGQAWTFYRFVFPVAKAAAP